MDASVATEDRLRAAEFEVYILRAALEGAIIGDQIIARQLECCEAGTILHWAWRQAASNISHLQNSLARSREDFPPRACTCHPDERPPVCQRRYAFTECMAVAPPAKRRAADRTPMSDTGQLRDDPIPSTPPPPVMGGSSPQNPQVKP